MRGEKNTFGHNPEGWILSNCHHLLIKDTIRNDGFLEDDDNLLLSNQYLKKDTIRNRSFLLFCHLFC